MKERDGDGTEAGWTERDTGRKEGVDVEIERARGDFWTLRAQPQPSVIELYLLMRKCQLLFSATSFNPVWNSFAP